ncbi:hypothetical protein AB0M02_06110 [Actinoplanes sp. NPDC051861]|uniref:hypothetical protein n=1 Tax=Actinoplanes sp. NPDC051861 TaxID=3155170 RepID=UPI0034169D29
MIMVIATGAAVALTAACGNSPEQVAGEAQPVGGASPAPSATSAGPATASPSAAPTTAQPSSPTPSRTAGKPQSRALVLGPTGLGQLKIGMSVKDAVATGEIKAAYKGEGCGSSELRAAGSSDITVITSSDKGLVFIPAYDRIATPAGIRIGSTIAQVRAAYSDFALNPIDEEDFQGTGRGLAGTEDRYDGVHYRFHFKNNKVAELALEHDEQNCYE